MQCGYPNRRVAEGHPGMPIRPRSSAEARPFESTRPSARSSCEVSPVTSCLITHETSRTDPSGGPRRCRHRARLSVADAKLDLRTVGEILDLRRDITRDDDQLGEPHHREVVRAVSAAQHRGNLETKASPFT